MKLRPSCLAAFLVFSSLQAMAFEWAVQPSPTPDPVQELIDNPYNKYYTKKDIDRVVDEMEAQKQRGSGMIKGQVITIDTRDQDTCARIQKELINSNALRGIQDPRRLCDQDPKNPITSVVILSPSNDVEWQREVNISRLTSSEQNMYTSTRNVTLAAAGVAGILYLLPESVSKWDKNKMKDVGNNWRENVKEGPVVDKDDWAINFIGHPYAGAAYYQIARHSGMGPWGSFGYSVVMSTFFWEYGVEAFAETPSIQDLIITPVIGSIMGEIFYRTELKIRANEGKVAGSKKLGSFLMIVMNPMGALSQEINELFGRKVVQDARARWVMRQQGYGTNHGGAQMESGGFWGFEIQFKF
ncbi:DUF3943 domain-containing protein [Bdellovibrio sp. HCB337]|uniref:DUF3943 domain-containing protein n=1 Tax=Bdellovibrio sp. HCB337 TaxID=3394358 RepID=UPI0039A6A958